MPNPLYKHISVLMFLVAGFLALQAFDAKAQIFQTKAKQVYMIDAVSGAVLLSKNEQDPMPPASLAKLMTLELVFHALKNDELSMQDEFLISENAWREGGANSGGSTMFAKLGSSVPLEALIQGVTVQSGNDACIAIAEGMAGNEASFAQMMNQRAEEIGLTQSHFVNATGLPAEGQHVTAKDLSRLARHIIDQYPEYYHFFSIPEFTWNKITQRNRNPTLGFTQGADGMKTGYTKESGYGLVSSAKRGDQRLIAVMNGMKSKKERREEARKLMDWGFRAFISKRVYDVDEEIAYATVHGGDRSNVMLVSERPISIFMARSKQGKLKGRIYYEGPLRAPLEEGAEVATLKIWSDDTLVLETPLVTGQAVGKGSLTQRAMDGLEELLLGWL